jgi:hypothetical protein
LENVAKDNRVLSFKLKKSDKSVVELATDKSDLEGRLKQMGGGSSALDNINRIRYVVHKNSVARWRFLKVIWRTKNISGRLPISGGFLADLTNSAQALFCLANLAEFWRFCSLH